MKNRMLFAVLGVVSYFSGTELARADYMTDCPGYNTLVNSSRSDIQLKPGETKTIVLDFTSPGCMGYDFNQFQAYIADAHIPVRECTNSVGKGLRMTLNMYDVTSDLDALKINPQASYFQDPNTTWWGQHHLTGHLVEIRLSMDPSARKCGNVWLRYAYSMSSY